MRDALLDIVQHTTGLAGMFDTIKVNGTVDQTNITGIANGRAAILKATFINPDNNFVGEFGMPNLKNLNIILGLPEYEDGTITLETQERSEGLVPVGLKFTNKKCDFKNTYRFMSKAQANEAVKTPNSPVFDWAVEIEPTLTSIQRLKYQSYTSDTIMPKTDGTDLKFYFGNHSTHSGDFVVQSNVSGNLSKGWNYAIKPIEGILNLPGDHTIKFGNGGMMLITVNSGIIEYDYYIPAQQ